MKKLELNFTNQDGRTVNYFIDQPVEPVDTAVMDEILQQNAFTSSGGDLVSKKRCKNRGEGC